MDKINVLWMNNGDESLLHFVDDAKKHGIIIDTCKNMKDCYVKLDSNKWDAIVINAVCRLEDEKPKISNLDIPVKKLRKHNPDTPRFVVLNKEKLNYIEHAHLKVLDESEEYYLLIPSAIPLYEAIRRKVINNPEAIVKRKYADVLNFLPDDKLIKLLVKLEFSDITKDTTIPNECRKILEKLKRSHLFGNVYISDDIFNGLTKEHEKDGDYNFHAETYKELSLNDFSRAFGLATNVPIHVKRSIYACTSVNQTGSHDTYIDTLIEKGEAPYATRTLLLELLNILHWCSNFGNNTFDLQIKRNRNNF